MINPRNKSSEVPHSTGLLFVIPTLGRQLCIEWAWAFKSLNAPINYNTIFLEIRNKPVDQARNEAIEHALKIGAKYLFFLGDDVVPPPHTLKQLIFKMENDPSISIIGGIYFSKSEPSFPLVFRGNGAGSYWDWKLGETFEITGIGMDCTLIRVEHIKSIPKPWFKTIDGNDFLDGTNHAEQWTEDLYFCNEVIKAGGRVMADASVICRHYDPGSGKLYGIPSNSLPTRMLQKEEGKTLKAIDIGCGPVDRRDQFKEYTLVRVDIREECNPDYRCDIRELPFENGEFDLVFSSHVLEHIPRNETIEVLKEWIRVLKPSGKLTLVLPNIDWAINKARELGTIESNDILNVLYGAQSNDYDYHYNGLNPSRVQNMMEALGVKFENVEFQGYNMILRGIKNGN